MRTLRSIGSVIYLLAAFLAQLYEANANSINQNRIVFDQLGTEINYFEKKFGPAKYKDGSWHMYEIGACSFYVMTTETKVTRISIAINAPKCDIELNGRRVSSLKFGDIVEEGGQFQSDCLNCGNSHDPVMTYVSQGGHASNFTDVLFDTYEMDFYDLAEKVAGGWSSDSAYKVDFDLNKHFDLIKRLTEQSPISVYGEGYKVFQN